MKLPDEKMLLVGRVAHGCFWADKPAALSDIRAAAKEMGYAVVPLADLNALEVGTDAYEYLDGSDARRMADGIYDLIEAAEGEK